MEAGAEEGTIPLPQVNKTVKPTENGTEKALHEGRMEDLVKKV